MTVLTSEELQRLTEIRNFEPKGADEKFLLGIVDKQFTHYEVEIAKLNSRINRLQADWTPNESSET